MRIEAMNIAFADSNIDKYNSLISGITLPDPSDRHIAEAAINPKNPTPP